MLGGDDGVFPGGHLLLQAVFVALVFFVEVRRLCFAGGEDGVALRYLGFEGFNLLLHLLDGILQLAALTLALGIAMMNFSEGATVSTPLREDGVPKSKRFWLGLLSGAIEPVAAALTFAALNGGAAAPLFLIAFVTGAILELTMETMGDDRSTVGTASFALGFVLMIVLKIVSDVTG